MTAPHPPYAPARPRPTCPRHPGGFTLLEMVLSMTVMAVAFAAIGSVFVLAGHVMPKPDSAEAASVEQSAALTRIAEDLRIARHVTAGSANSITLVVEDQTGDALPDRITYAWSGIAGDPLTYTINGSTPVTLAEDVRHFSLSLTDDKQTDRVPLVNETSTEQALISHTNPAQSETVTISSGGQLGQIVTPALPIGATSYSVSRVRFRARSNGLSYGGTHLRVRSYDTENMNLGYIQAANYFTESALDDDYRWESYTLSPPPTFDNGQSCAVMFEWDYGNATADITYDNAGGGNLLWSTNGGGSYTLYNAKGVVAEVLGTVLTQMPGIELTRTLLTQAQISLTTGNAPTQTASVRMFCEPGVYSAAWESGFDASPVGIDMQGNGADWAAQGGVAAGAFSGGRWDVDGQLYTQPTHSFDQPMVIDLTMGATTANRAGAQFQINADQADGKAVPLTLRVGQDASGGYTVRVYDDESLQTPRLEIPDLGEHPPHVRLLVVPDDNAVGLILNGEPAGSFTYEPVNASGLSGIATLSQAASGYFDQVSICVGGLAVVTHPEGGSNSSGESGGGGGGGGLLGGILNGLGL